MDITLFVRDLEGNLHGVEVPATASVQELLDQLEGIVPTEGCGLLLGDVPLGRDEEIAETGASPDDVLQLTSNKINLKWQLFDNDPSNAACTENDTVIINKNQATRNWDAHTTPLVPLMPGGTTFSFTVQSMYDPSWTTSIGVAAEGLRAGRGCDEMVQVSIGEKGTVQWDTEELSDYSLKFGSILEFHVDSYPFSSCDAEQECQVNVSIYVHVDGRRILGKGGSFVTKHRSIQLACYCYAPGQGWRVINDH
eukprot:TRINITY_DN34699_c0_g1_i1.p1 TRINITY_DN34699_c0_g1~~TRINITY_DN34699_c0_g1_i1.p1  ORF type:complete len:293 (+),score=99.83 TRINITY_DN34699_c0_g1_i1:125-880(+)